MNNSKTDTEDYSLEGKSAIEDSELWVIDKLTHGTPTERVNVLRNLFCTAVALGASNPGHYIRASLSADGTNEFFGELWTRTVDALRNVEASDALGPGLSKNHKTIDA